jgi:hypothetical protein
MKDFIHVYLKKIQAGLIKIDIGRCDISIGNL